MQNNFDNVLVIVLGVSHYSNIDGGNSWSLILSKTRNEALIFAISSYKFIFFTKKRVLKRNTINDKASCIRFFYFEQID